MSNTYKLILTRVVALSVMLASTTISWADISVSPSQCSLRSLPENPLNQANASDEELQFRKLVEGRMKPRDGAYTVSFGRWQSQDGIVVERLVEGYHSTVQARDAMAKMLRDADTIFEQGYKEDKKGNRIGERAVLSVRPGDQVQLRQHIVWRNGSKLFVIASTSMRHCSAFEKQVYP